MFGLSSYYSFFYLFLYCSTVVIICSVNSFYVLWFFMEFLMLSLMGFMFTLVTSSFVELMIFFLVQTISSLSVFIMYTNDLPILMAFSILIKLGMFPFISWFVFSMSKLPNSLLFISSTLHKIPPFLLVTQFMPCYFSTFFMISINVTCWLASIFMCTTADVRTLIIFSSVANTSWMLLSSISSFTVFISYLVVYSLFMGFLMLSFNSLSKITISSGVCITILLLLIVSGFPPSPIFFLKAFLLNSSISVLSLYSFHLVSLALGSVLLVFSYFRLSFIILLNRFNSVFLI